VDFVCFNRHMLKYTINEKKVAWRLLDNEAVIINTDTSFYYTLNGAGTYIWNILDKEKRTPEEIIQKTASYYGKDEKSITKDVKSILKDLNLNDDIIKYNKLRF